MIITVLCAMGNYKVELGTNTVQDLPRLIEGAGGIVVPIDDIELDNKLWIPAAQILGITWHDGGIVAVPDETAEVADVSYIGEEEPTIGPVTGDKGINGELFIDS